MPRARFYNLPTQERSRLIRIATRHFARRGLDGASLNEILTEARISKGAYYYYFDDKDDLLATVLDDAVEGMLAKLSVPDLDRVTAEEFWPTVERWVGTWPAVLDTSSDIFRVAAQFTASRRASPRFAPILAKAQALYRRLIEPGQRLGCVRTDLPMEVLIRLLEANDAALDAVFLSMHADVTPETMDRHMRLVFDTFKRLLAAAPPSSVEAR
jgi:AcrR family transcriptional regulator